MKTSNKILIAFAVALILIPVLGMVIVSATQYKTGSYKDIADQKIENFSTPTKNMTSIALASPFETVNIADGKGLAITIHLIKDEKFGIKIQNKFKDLVVATVDASGQLQLNIKDQVETEENRIRYTNIYVYGPNLKSLNVTNLNDLNVTSTADSLTLNTKKMSSLSFESGTHIKQLNLKTIDVERLSFNEDDIKSINLDLEHTNLYIGENSFENAAITTRGNCEVEIGNDYNNAKKQTISNLVLNTNGVATVKVQNTTIANCSGKLSDETQVQMPAANLNQMYKK
ncbi:hypothetical protein [Pedobacter boryungensis]|uniref:Auto-transporter adhesin head GIN domain-containing protein n=1 Tax=Pedobacter boryungensis TaxID=869962 RepID=A0ABX2DCH7_9SPHI|nr:hypothetical protein [Pedobacter boryungensis]NQX31786.1 hypothetical protein [Pedobacter boryungensis]